MIGLEPNDGSGRHRTSSSAIPPARQASIGLGFSPSTQLGEERVKITTASKSSENCEKLRKRLNLQPRPQETETVESFAHNPHSASASASPLLLVHRKVKALLNKLTTENFESISDQIIAWSDSNSANEEDGPTLMHITTLILENATCSAMWSGLYAWLCKKIMEQISPKVKAKNDGFNHTVGGGLFRKYLIIQCENAFKIGCITTASTTIGALEDGAFVAKDNGEYGESAQKERRVLGLTMFMVELFKLQILTEVIMHEYIMTLLWGVDGVPESEEIESFCNLLTMVGSTLDKPQAMSHMRAFIYRMEELMKNPQVTPRLQFMLLVYIVHYSNHLVINLFFF